MVARQLQDRKLVGSVMKHWWELGESSYSSSTEPYRRLKVDGEDSSLWDQSLAALGERDWF